MKTWVFAAVAAMLALTASSGPARSAGASSGGASKIAVQPDLTLAAPDDVLAPDFRGQITYRGFFQAQMFVPGPPPTKLSVKAMMASAAQAKTFSGGGDYVVTMEFNGPNVTGATQITNAARGDGFRLDPGRFNGKRDGVACHLWWNDGTETIAYCGKSEYREKLSQSQPDGAKISVSARSPAAQLVDYVERDRLAAIAAQKREAERQQELARTPPTAPAAPARAVSGAKVMAAQYEHVTTCAAIIGIFREKADKDGNATVISRAKTAESNVRRGVEVAGKAVGKTTKQAYQTVIAKIYYAWEKATPSERGDCMDEFGG